MKTVGAGYLLVLGLVAGCSPAIAPQAAPSPTRSLAQRPPTRPRRARTVFRAGLQARRRLRRAERDLQRVHLWGRLSGHLYEVRVAVRPGRPDIPQDRHLADAYPSAVTAPGGFGSLCDIVFYPSAIAADLVRWRRFHAQDRLGPAPASLRQYWATILAHELAHCLGHGKGERVARHWEGVALERLRRRKVE